MAKSNAARLCPRASASRWMKKATCSRPRNYETANKKGNMKQIREFPSSLMTGYQTYTPGKLLDIAAEMTRSGIESIDFEIEEVWENSHSIQCRERRLETDQEYIERIEKDRKFDEQREQYGHATYLRLQRKFGKQ